MNRETKVTTLALIMSHGYGDAAPIVALRRAREYRQAKDYSSALVWLDVVLRLARNAARNAEAPIAKIPHRAGLAALAKGLAVTTHRGA